MRHVHDFAMHCGLRTSFGTLAWVPSSFVFGGNQQHPEMYRCLVCGEQGYEVPR